MFYQPTLVGSDQTVLGWSADSPKSYTNTLQNQSADGLESFIRIVHPIASKSLIQNLDFTLFTLDCKLLDELIHLFYLVSATYSKSLFGGLPNHIIRFLFFYSETFFSRKKREVSYLIIKYYTQYFSSNIVSIHFIGLCHKGKGERLK